MGEAPLHGREAPLAALRSALANAHEGRGSVALVSGGAGIGKSALVNALADEATGAGVPVVLGRAWEFADAPPYFPVSSCLRSIGVEPDDGQAFHLWERTLQALARHASATPMVWILEDLHAADLGTLDLVTFLAHPIRATRALIIGTVRDPDPGLTDRKQQRLGRIAHEGLSLALQPLSEPDVAAVAESILGRGLSPVATRRLTSLTGGNPLFVVECVRAAGQTGVDELSMSALPTTVRQVVSDRASLLPDAARDALASGAVLGREFHAATVAHMHDTDPVRVLDTLQPALASGLVRESGLGRLTFRHALVCDAVYADIAQAERVRLHDRAERALAEKGDAADVLVERARHALLAAPLGRAEHALSLADRALDLLEREGAYDRALALCERVRDGRAAGLLPPASYDDKLRTADIARAAGRRDVAQELCAEVIASARQTGDHEALARAALCHAHELRMAVIDPWQIQVLEEARDRLGEDSPGLSCRVLARLSTALQPADDPAVPAAMAHRALSMARALNDDAAILDVLALGGMGTSLGPLSECIAWTQELRDRARAARDVPRELTARSWLTYFCASGGDHEGYARAVRDALDLSTTTAHPHHRWGPLMLAAGHRLSLGHLARADRYVTEVTQLAALVDDPSIAMSLHLFELFRARLVRDRAAVERQLASLETVTAGVKRSTEFIAVASATCWARLGDVERTRAQLELIDIDSVIATPNELIPGFVADAYALAGTEGDCRRIRDRLSNERVEELFAFGLSFTYEGPLARAIGLLDAALGDHGPAERTLRKALSDARERGLRPWVAEIARDLASVLRGSGRPSEAAALDREARAIATELGMSTEAPPPPEPEQALELERLGQVWTLARAGRVAHVKHSRGMELLARLVERSGEEIHVLTLMSDGGTPAPNSSAGELIDDQARSAYRQRLAQLARELGDATGDSAQRLRQEKTALERELARATGLGGRARTAGSASERARSNAQRRLKTAVAHITEVDPALGSFVARALHTGTYCCFRP